MLIHYYNFSVHVHTYIEEMFGKDAGYRKRERKTNKKCKNNIRNINNTTKKQGRKKEWMKQEGWKKQNVKV